MARIGAPHGVRGAVRLTVFAEDPLGLRRYNPFQDAAGTTFKLVSIKQSGAHIVAAFDGIDDRDAAAALRGTELSIPRARLPRTDPDEFYYVDLVGLDARLADGTPVGRVHGVADFGAGEVVEIRGGTGFFLPFTKAAVPDIDLAAGIMTINPPDLRPAEPDRDDPAPALADLREPAADEASQEGARTDADLGQAAAVHAPDGRPASPDAADDQAAADEPSGQAGGSADDPDRGRNG